MANKAGPHLLGRKRPPDNEHVEKHPFRLATDAPHVRISDDVEQLITIPRYNYDQGDSPQCVAFSTQRIMSYYNKRKYDAPWLYKQCKGIDPWPNEDGTSARYAFDILREAGDVRLLHGQDMPISSADGIDSNTWATSATAVRSALALGHPVNLGVRWPYSWFKPSQGADGDWWLPDFDDEAGGHEIGAWAWSDRRDAVGLVNTWGRLYPTLVWLKSSYLDGIIRSGETDAGIIADRVGRSNGHA